jgi:Tfp pilus assembly protein PilF
MLAQEPNDVELRYMLAMEHVSEGDDPGALGRFEELIAMAPNYPHAYHQAGRVLQRLGRVAEAKSWLHQGIPIAQKAGDLHAAGEMQGLLESME